MNKIYSLLVALAFTFSLQAQNSYQEEYADLPDGEYEENYMNGHKKWNITKQNAYVVDYISYERDGQLEKSLHFKNGLYHGIQIMNYGSRMSSEYFVENDTLISAKILISYKRLEQVKQKMEYDKKNITLKWNKDVSFVSDGLFLLAQENCYVSNYYKNGKLKSEGWLINNKKRGEWKFYDESGTEVKKESF